MKNITLWQRLRQVSISTSLRCAFLMGALLTLIVSSEPPRVSWRVFYL